MKKTIYVSFDVDANSYQEAETKLKHDFKLIDKMLSDTILLNSQEKKIRNILNTFALVNKVRI